MSVGTRVGRTFDSLSIYNYRVFWLGQLVSITGTWMQATAQAWLVLKLTDSPVALGTVTMLQFLPITVLALFGGVFADRLPKRTVLLCTQTLAALQALLLGGLVLLGAVQLWQIYVLALVLGIVNAFDNPTRQAFVSELVGKDHIQNAVALNSMLFNSARVVGPAIGGVVISAAGVGQAFLLNGLSFAPVIAGLLMIRRQELIATERSRQSTVLRQVGEGLRYVARTPAVLVVMLTMAVVGTFGYNYNTILPLIARYVLHAGALGLGALSSAVGLGSLFAALGVASAPRATGTILLGAAMIFATLLILVGLSPSLPLTLILLALMGVTGIVFTAGANTRLQLQTPPELRGRVLSLYFLLFAGTTPLGGLLVGVLAARAGVQSTVVAMGCVCLVGVSASCVYAWRTRSETSGPTPIPTPAPRGTPSETRGRA